MKQITKNLIFILFAFDFCGACEHPIENRDTATSIYDWVFRGRIIKFNHIKVTDGKDNIVDMYPISFWVDTVYKGSVTDTVTADYYDYDPGYCQAKQFNFRKNQIFEIGMNRVNFKKLTSFMTSKENPHVVGTKYYPWIFKRSYFKEINPPSPQ